jgi:hypothetical protein
VDKENKLKVIYIASGGHSGSTLLSFILGSAKEVFNAGELKYFGSIRDYQNPTIQFMGNRCSCGAEADKCAFWVDIEHDLGPDFQIYTPEGLAARLKLALGLFLPLRRSHSTADRPSDDYRLGRLILERARRINPSAQFILDASKSLDRLFALRADSRLDIKVLFLVRDGRGYINSYRKIYGRGFLRWLLQWIVVNVSARYYLGKEEIDHYSLSYEQFCDQPEAFIKEINRHFGISIPVDDYARAVRETVFHVRAGNPMKGSIKDFQGVFKDQKWQTELPRFQSWLSTALLGAFNRRWVYGQR